MNVTNISKQERHLFFQKHKGDSWALIAQDQTTIDDFLEKEELQKFLAEHSPHSLKGKTPRPNGDEGSFPSVDTHSQETDSEVTYIPSETSRPDARKGCGNDLGMHYPEGDSVCGKECFGCNDIHYCNDCKKKDGSLDIDMEKWHGRKLLK